MQAARFIPATMETVILLSSPRPEGVAVIISLPAGARIVLEFSEGEIVDVSPIAADVLVRYLLSGSAERLAQDGVLLGDLRLENAGTAEVQFATADLFSGTVGDIPAERLLPLLAAALAAEVEAAASVGTGGQPAPDVAQSTERTEPGGGEGN